MKQTENSQVVCRILLLDDHWLLRTGIKAVLALHPEEFIFEISEADTGERALSILEHQSIDILLADHHLEGMSGPETIMRSKRFLPDLKILALSGFCDAKFIGEMMDAGAQGYLVKTVLQQQLLQAIRAVWNGQKYFCSEAALALMEAGEIHDQLSRTYHLKPREIEVLKMIVDGKTNDHISRILFLAKRTIDVYRQNLLVKLKVRNTAALVSKAIQLGLVN